MHIQILKKSICKGDKKKKKEVTEEIARLESELDKKQEEESLCEELPKITLDEPLREVEARQSEDTVQEESAENVRIVPIKVSKAQKRRDKKANAERERNERIIEQEAINIFGKRNVETQAIRKILVDRDLMIYEIPSDGHW